MARTQVTSAMMKAPEAGTQTYGASTSVLRSITTDVSGRIVSSISTNSTNPDLVYRIDEHFANQGPTFDGGITSFQTGGGQIKTASATEGLDNQNFISGILGLATGTNAAGTSGPMQGAGIATTNSPSISIYPHSQIQVTCGLYPLDANWFDSNSQKGVARVGLMQSRINDVNYANLPSSLITSSDYEPKYGMYFRAKNSRTLQAVTRNNNTETVTTLSSILTAGTWIYLKVAYGKFEEVDTVFFLVNNVLVASHTGNIPLVSLGFGMHLYRDFGTNQTSANNIEMRTNGYSIVMIRNSAIFG